MTKVIVTKEKIDNVANAIRVKTGSSDSLTLDGMADAVGSIATGGSGGVEIPSELPHGDKTTIQDDAEHYLYLFDRTGLIGGPTLFSSKDIVSRGIPIADKRIGVYAGTVDESNLITTVTLEKGSLYGTVVGTDGAGGNTYFILFKAVNGVWVKQTEGSIPYSDQGQRIYYWYSTI